MDFILAVLLTCAEGRELLDRIRSSEITLSEYIELEDIIREDMPKECYHNAND